VPPGRGRIEAPIFRHPSNRKKMAVVSTGRRAVTEYSVVQKWLKFALLNVDLLTGRTHQIRVHLSYVHHPVVGDELYGGLHRSLSSAPSDDVRTAIEMLSGQALHAARLGFSHPVTGGSLEFEAPVPEDMQRVIQLLDEEP
jgi:23S rRNA pseudouridine1911/1915/1917 synthase